jgi:hypothetical protein
MFSSLMLILNNYLRLEYFFLSFKKKITVHTSKLQNYLFKKVTIRD